MIEILTTEKVWVENLARALIGPSTDVDDVVHDTWMATLVAPPQTAERSRGWLRSVVRNIVGRRRYAAVRRRIVESRAGRREAIDGGPSAIETLELHDILIRAVQSLPTIQRDVVVLSYFRGESSAEIARRLDMPAATVRSHLARALAKLRDLLDQKWNGDRSAWCWALAPLALGQSAAGGSAAVAAVRSVIELGGTAVSKKSAAAFSALLLITFAIGVGYFFLADDDASLDVAASNPATIAAEETTTPRRTAKNPDSPAPLGNSLPSSPTSSPTEPCRLEIKGADGRAVKETGVVIARGSDVIASTTTDAEGKLLLGAEYGPAEAIVLIAKFAVVSAEIEIAPGLRTVTLPALSPLSGRVTVDGQVPLRPLSLDLTPRERRFPKLAAPVAAAVGDRLSKARPKDTATTGEGGAFSFFGVDEEFAGMIDLPIGYGKRDMILYSRRVTIEAPSDRLFLEIVTLPVVSGRVIAGPLERPVPGAIVHIDYGAADSGTQLVLGETTTDEKGEYRDVLLAKSATSVTLRAEKGGAVTTATLPGKIEGPVRAPDLLLEELRTIRFAIQSSDKSPIAGAVVETTKGSTKSTVSDELGISTIENVASTEFEVEVRAAGHAARKVTVPPRVDDVVTVMLDRTNRLIVIVKDPTGGPAKNRYVRLSAEKSPLVGKTARELEGVPPVGGQVIETSNFDRKMNARYFASDARGRIEIEGVTPGMTIEVAAIDRLRRVVGRPETVRIDEFEEVTVEIVGAAQLPHDVAGIVRDEVGAAIAEAQVTLHEPLNGIYQMLTADENGRFTLRGVDFESCDVMVHTTDKRSLRIRGCAMPKPGENLELRLKPKRTDRFTIELDDEKGRPVDGEVSVVFDGGIWGAVKRDDVGRYSLGLEFAEPVEVVAKVGGRTFKVPVAAGETKKKVNVPATGTIRVVWSTELDTARTYRVILRSNTGDGPSTIAIDGDTLAKRGITIPGTFEGQVSVAIEAQKDGQSSDWSTVVGPRSVTVESGRTIDVSL